MSTEATLKQTPILDRFGPWRLLERIGVGEMGEVYRTQNVNTREFAALKILNPKYALDDIHLARFQRESRIVRELFNPYLVHGLDSGFEERLQRHYLVMEYVSGPTLQSILEKQPVLSLGNALRIILDAAMGLSSAHQKNIIHRDVKPANILITSAGRAKLTDLGLSKSTSDVSELTQTKHGFGTPYYMAFEQAISARGATERSDVFSLGVTLYQMLAGTVPFPGETPLEVTERKKEGSYDPITSRNKRLPKVMNTLIDKMLARDPAARFSSAVEVVFAVESLDLAYDRYIEEKVDLSDINLPLSEQSTNVDVRQPTQSKKRKWYLRYRNQKQELVLRMADTQQVIKALSSGILLETTEISRDKEGPFLPVTHFMEFRESLDFDDLPMQKTMLNRITWVTFALLALLLLALLIWWMV